MMKMLTPVVYTCSTDFFNEMEIEEIEPLCDIEVPEEIVRAYYDSDPSFADETAYELGIPVEEATFERWYNEVYVAESMMGLYDFAKAKGYQPRLV